MQCHENTGAFLDGANPLDIQMLSGVTAQHALKDTMHVSYGWRQGVDRGLFHEPQCFIGCRERAMRRAVMNLRAAAPASAASIAPDNERVDSDERDHLSPRRAPTECTLGLLRARPVLSRRGTITHASFQILHQLPDVVIRGTVDRPLSADHADPARLRRRSPG
jgi:hypothetical protein